MLPIRVLLAGTPLLFAACGDDGGTDEFTTTDRPGKRSDIGAVFDTASEQLLVFGGDDGPIVNQIPSPAYLGDTWLLSPNTGWQRITTSASPSARGRYAISYDPGASRALLFGGRFRTAGTTGNYTLYNDTWAFDFNAQTWTQTHDGSGLSPSPRYFPASAYDRIANQLVLWGGDTNPSPVTVSLSTEVWAYANSAWQQRTPQGAAPSPRLWVGYTHDSKRNRLIVFGGQIGDFITPALNDLYALDLPTTTWSQLHAGGASAPSGRFSSFLTYDETGDRYLLMGGHADQGVTNDVWAFDPNDNSWTVIHAGDSFTGAPLGCLNNMRELPKNYVTEDLTAPERRSTGVVALLGTSLWLFGGESDCSEHLDDLWRLDLETAQWSELVPARSGESCARRNDACECLCL